MINKLLFGSALHEHAEPAQRVLGIAALPPDSKALAQLLGADPAPEARAAAAARCVDLDALASAWLTETDADVREAIAASLTRALAAAPDSTAAQSLLATPSCADAFRAEVALHTQDADRRRVAIDGIGDENILVDIALAAAHAPVRLAAADRVHAAAPLRRLADAAKDKDRGVARLARQRLDAINRRAEQAAEADALLAQAEALATQTGPIVMAAVELDRRWKALDLAHDADRRARWEAIGQQLQQRFEREHEAQRAHTQFERRLNEWLLSLQASPASTALPTLRSELIELRTLAMQDDDAPALAKLVQAEQQIVLWEQEAPALAAAEALVLEAEQLAAGTPIDDAQLPQRWQKIDLAARTPALTRRFEAALLVIEQRRLAQVRAAQQQQNDVRQQLHALLHTAEQALAAGQLQEARAGADEIRALKADAGMLPKPTVQRLSRLVQQLGELERWQSFGQHNARTQLCERAEAVLQQTLAPAALAREVQGLRAEWKKLDEQHAGVPKPLWERFDSACEKAYAPAARHFAEVAALHKQARKQRQDFIVAAAAHAPTLLTEPHDRRAIEHWLRETESTWRGTTLGSVEPGAWKKLDARLKAALAPLREVLSAARHQAITDRQALIAEATALAARAMERETLAQVKELQARWQAQAKSMPLMQRDERALWEQFRSACNAVFDARKSSRKEADGRKHEQRRAFETLCEQLEQLAHVTDADADETQTRRTQRDLQEQWKKALTDAGPVPAALEARFRAARGQVEAMLGARTRAEAAAVWQALLAKAQLCEELDTLVLAEPDADKESAAAASVQQRWSALPPLAAEWEQKILARRDAALQSFADEDLRYDRGEEIEKAAATRGDALLELELLLGIDSPADLQPRRLVVQVKQIRDRFKRASTASAGTAGEILLEWCTLPGVADGRDHQRCERIVASLGTRR